MQSTMNGCRLSAEASGIMRMRIRPITRAIGLSGDHNQGLIRLLAALGAFLQTADVGLIDLDPAAQPISVWPDHRPSQLVQPAPSCLVTSQPEHTLQP